MNTLTYMLFLNINLFCKALVVPVLFFFLEIANALLGTTGNVGEIQGHFLLNQYRFLKSSY